jgi:eukaryotic-like serine/threonine-protein kinase
MTSPPPPPPPPPPPDDKPYQAGKLFGAYTLQRIIAEGGMGVVIEAEHNVIKRLVALKTVSPKYAAKEGFRLALMDTFMRDARILGKIDHPNVLPVYDAGTVGHCPFIAMRLVAGGDLATWITSNGPIKQDIALHVAHDCASGLKAIHAAGFIHRDIKPLNILIEPDWRVFISDFGLALPKGQKPPAGTIAGTPCYLAPEQIRGEDLDERTDIYALGATLFHAVTGTPPYSGSQPEEIMRKILESAGPPSAKALSPSLDERLDAIIMRAMSLRAVERYNTTDEFMSDCSSVINGGSPDFAMFGRRTRKTTVFGSIAQRVFGSPPPQPTNPRG